MTDRIPEAVRQWQLFAKALKVQHAGKIFSWKEYIAREGYTDEERLIQPIVFPEFARQLLDFTVGLNLAPEEPGQEGKPDFTPGDSVTHPFVFETKGTAEGASLEGHKLQLQRYLAVGYPRIRKVVLTNLVGIRIFRLDDNAELIEEYSVDLRLLLAGPESEVATTGTARRFADFLDEFRRKELTSAEKLQRVREAPEWNPVVESTSPTWLLGRLDTVVRLLTTDVQAQVNDGVLTNPAVMGASERSSIRDELRLLASRLGAANPDELDIQAFLRSSESTPAGKARVQFCAHVAYYAATRLMLVRVWEDLGLLQSMLHDGGFDRQMKRFEDVITDVVDFSFNRARTRYRSLFDQRNNYTWYQPTESTYIETIYELANTYLGSVESDVLGQVYERMLERIDRKLLGQYYTPRDIIALIWDLINADEIARQAEEAGRAPRVLDIAAGSGGFLVELSARMRRRLDTQQRAGAAIGTQDWINRIAAGANGVEIQRFSAYLAELNLLVQIGHILTIDPSLRIPNLGIISTDTLSLHTPDSLFDLSSRRGHDDLMVTDSEDARNRALRIKDAYGSDFLMDVACGNPPYIGEKIGASILNRTRREYPYWEQFVGQHMDYLYWFLILGISKLRQGGRFGFITTEYWLRSVGAKPLRKYVAQRCRVDRVILFRRARLFPDAPGQDSMIIIGERLALPDGGNEAMGTIPHSKPLVSIYDGPSISVQQRRPVLDAFRSNRTGSRFNTRTFRAPVSPNALGETSWSEVALTSDQFTRRRQLLSNAAPLEIDTDEGVLSAADRMRTGYDRYLSAATLQAIQWPERKAGIFVLSADEVRALGQLNESEQRLLRPVVNTKDLLPYAAVAPTGGPSMIYLAAPAGSERESADIVQALPFPSGLPALEGHLRVFKPLLEYKVHRYGERRPWWSLHRPRPDIIAHDRDQGWADFCLTTRWGIGQRLVVGLAPAKSVPASGLHALYAPEGVPASYVCGLLNSTAVQDLAETLPPGNLTADDIRELGLALISDQVAPVAATTEALAQTVDEFVCIYQHRFPNLLAALLEDIALDSIPFDAWMPEPGPTTEWGQIDKLNWIDEIASHGKLSRPILETQVTEDLYGLRVNAQDAHDASVSVGLRDNDRDLAECLAAYLLGAGAAGKLLSAIPSLLAPVDPSVLTSARVGDRAALSLAVSRYRSLRKDIDDRVDAVI